MSVLLIKDDTDSGFEYLGQWNTLSSDSPNVERNTLHSTTEIGASASFTDIQGDAVAVYITVPMCPSTDAVIGRVSIDNGTPEDVRIGCNATAVEDGVAFWSFSKGRLPSSGRHRIVITNQGSVPLQLDSLKFGNFSLTLPTIFSSTPTKTDTSVGTS
ncbi:hypothetical protein B0H34DRAFT_503066 [Crassisporium funariophilum]|nr:hypothetical protein B0H34DRAFT_503066 [Crassisporium funariophilum]